MLRFKPSMLHFEPSMLHFEASMLRFEPLMLRFEPLMLRFEPLMLHFEPSMLRLEASALQDFCPEAALLHAAIRKLGLSELKPFELERERVIEYRLAAPARLASMRVNEFIDELSSDSSRPRRRLRLRSGRIDGPRDSQRWWRSSPTRAKASNRNSRTSTASPSEHKR
jgi:hypothetical protein